MGNPVPLPHNIPQILDSSHKTSAASARIATSRGCWFIVLSLIPTTLTITLLFRPMNRNCHESNIKIPFSYLNSGRTFHAEEDVQEIPILCPSSHHYTELRIYIRKQERKFLFFFLGRILGRERVFSFFPYFLVFSYKFPPQQIWQSSEQVLQV